MVNGLKRSRNLTHCGLILAFLLSDLFLTSMAFAEEKEIPQETLTKVVNSSELLNDNQAKQLITFSPIINTPKDDSSLKYISPVLVFLGIAINCFMFFFTIKDKKNERQSSVMDGFWFRSIILPDIQNSAKLLADKHLDYWKDILEKCKSEEAAKISFNDYIQNEFQGDAHIILSKTDHIAKIDKNLFDGVGEMVSEYFDTLENDLTNNCIGFELANNNSDKIKIAKLQIGLFKHLELALMCAVVNPHTNFALKDTNLH